MAKVIVTPETYNLVFFDSGRIAELVGEAADKAGFAADAEIRVEVDERVPLGRTKTVSLDPISIWVEGGAFEDAKRPRQLSDQSVQDVAGRLLFRAHDRLGGGFADAPDDDGLTLPQQVAWDAYAVGRAERAGLPASRSRRLYHFRNRHGFNDVADAAFDRLWNGVDLTWADIEAACQETAAAKEAASA
ncbi:MAG: hypothetical protein QOG03_385 [Actinomycetota bacterium]|jgi:hypothetical protein|nr:hypothetical protein [Actinomycetota bacterium]